MDWWRLARSRGVLSIVLALSISALVAGWIYAIGGPSELRERYGLLGPAVSLVGHTLVNITPIADLVPWALANGAVWGVWQGALLSWLAFLGATAAQWAIARRTADEFDLNKNLEKLPRWVRRLPVHHPVFLTAVRWLPTGGLVSNSAAGALGVPFPRLFGFAALGYAPPSVFLALAGAGVFELLTRS